MQNGYLRYIKGCVAVRLCGGSVERFLNICRQHGIFMWNIRRADGEACVCEVRAADFKRMIPYLKKTGTRAKIIKKTGIPFYFPFFKKRIIFFAGVAGCLAALNFTMDYVWAVEYVGNVQISDDELSDFLDGENIHYGAKKDSISCEEEEKRLRERFPNVTWTSIYFEGTKLYVEIKENEKSEPVSSQVEGTDIVADESGEIVSIITRNGVPNVKAGDIVDVGDVLVSGSVPVYNEEQEVSGYQIYDADADIYIKTELDYHSEQKRAYSLAVYTDNDASVGFLEAFGYHIDAMWVYDLFFADDEYSHEIITEKKQLVLLDGIYLPVYYGKITKKEYYIKYMAYTDEELKKLLSSELDKFISDLEQKGVQIVEKNVRIEGKGEAMEMNGTLLAVKPTGVSSAIEIEIKEQESGELSDRDAD